MPSPDQFGRYRVEKPLGSGAFAVVWLAHDDRLEAPVAVKVMAENWACRMDIRDRFLAEARLLRKASSGGVVQVFDVGELDDERPYFVMEYADRGTVADRLAGGPLPVPEALWLTAEASRGVRALHEAGVAHRDIKPSNVLLASGGARGSERVLVADLGLAKNLAQASGLTVVAGSAGYMAPEQAEPFDGIDARADVYSLGALLHHLVTGTVPGAPGRVPPLGRVRPGLPRELEEVVGRALEPDRDRRWPTAGAFAHELDRLAESVRRLSEDPGTGRAGLAGGAGGVGLAGAAGAAGGVVAAGGGAGAGVAQGAQERLEAPEEASTAAEWPTGAPASRAAREAASEPPTAPVSSASPVSSRSPASSSADPDSSVDSVSSADSSGAPTSPANSASSANFASPVSSAEPATSARSDSPSWAASPPAAASAPIAASPTVPASSSEANPADAVPADGVRSDAVATDAMPADAARSDAVPSGAVAAGASQAGRGSRVGYISPVTEADSEASTVAEAHPATAQEPSSAAVPPSGAGPHPASPPTGRRRRGRTALVLTVAVAALAGAGAAVVKLRPDEPKKPDETLVHDASGRISMKIPAEWAGEVTRDGWRPSSIGLPADHAPGMLVAEDVKGWKDLTSKTSGVFVGLGGDSESGENSEDSKNSDGKGADTDGANGDERTNGARADAGKSGDTLADKVGAISHRTACQDAASRAYKGENWQGRIRTWSSCASSGISLEEISLTPRHKGKPPVYVQIRCDEDCVARTDKVLGSLEVSGASEG
ncbi:serine/threonine-protein kinase [Streptomyces tubbatahanensis]|uniref:serine/threonine-protein kinase n=1 Tax=Streptomyces tubbatahanensis TaxID=2923272 RepID=UPI00311B429C